MNQSSMETQKQGVPASRVRQCIWSTVGRAGLFKILHLPFENHMNILLTGVCKRNGIFLAVVPDLSDRNTFFELGF